MEVLQFPRKRPLLIGHRGCRGKMPENTFAAFDYAVESGCDGIEFDVRRTADGRAVILHDATLRGLPVAEATYEALLERRVGKIKRMFSFVSAAAPKMQLEPIPCVDEVVEYYGETAFLYIELKVAGLESEAVDLLRRVKPKNGFVIASFLPEVVRATRALDPKIPVGFICDNLRELAKWRDLDCTHVMPQHKLLTRSVIDELNAARKTVFTWTVNSQAEMRRVATLGVDGIVSDDPELLFNTFGQQ